MGPQESFTIRKFILPALCCILLVTSPLGADISDDPDIIPGDDGTATMEGTTATPEGSTSPLAGNGASFQAHPDTGQGIWGLWTAWYEGIFSFPSSSDDAH